MNLDFSKCKTAEDVKKVFEDNKIQIEQLNEQLNKLKNEDESK